jgi:hypothetical protein
MYVCWLAILNEEHKHPVMVLLYNDLSATELCGSTEFCASSSLFAGRVIHTGQKSMLMLDPPFWGLGGG